VSRVPAGGGAFAARFVAIDATTTLAPGEIVWDRSGRIVALRRPRGPVADVGVVPGLVNAHAHLQLAPLPIVERRFVPWLSAVMTDQAAATASGRRAAVAQAAATLAAEGTTTVGEIDASGDSVHVLARSPLRGRCYRELTGFHLDGPGARRLLRDRAEGRSTFARGWSPHAPYSVSAALFTAAARSRRWLAIHCAEVPDEQQFLATGQGPFAELLRRLGRLPAGFRAPGVGAVRWLERLGALHARTLLVHCQELQRGDRARIAAAGASIVVCPGTIDWFRRTPPPVAAWLRAGIPVALGTDSRASNVAMSMRRELARARALWPDLRDVELLAMATQNGGRALGLPACGHLRTRGFADFVVVPARATFAATLARFVAGDAEPVAVFLGGRAVPTAPSR
jgi:cytosine/adenosine deaminase-related metal-dependent hydrolase